MGQKLHNRIEIWKKLLLDFGKRNRLINFLEGKRSNVNITIPSFDRLWESVVVNERELEFPYAKKVKVNDEGEEVYEAVVKGDIETTKPINELQKTLKALRYRANTSIEEQGINILYLTFGMLKWKEHDNTDQVYSSPIILVPVRLLIESIASPYRLVLHDDEIVVNPTLSHKLDNDFGITMPEFDSTHDSPSEYLDKILSKVKNKGWNVECSTHLTTLSFLKINMYKDLERNEAKINTNSVVAALVGEKDSIQVPEELNNFDHDRQIRPIDTFQVVDADSSQQDAVLLSKKGVSFVLQGPPGTGKSQTITNIIAEAIADGKKVLFVSEKMAALQVVYNRLASVGLADFCFTLHSHKAKKKDILRDLANSISIDRTRAREEALAQLGILEKKRDFLNEYQEELHSKCSGLNISIFTANGRLAKLCDAPDVIFSISDPESVTTEMLNERVYLLGELSKTIGKQGVDFTSNVWRGSKIDFLTNALRHDIDSNISRLTPLMRELESIRVSICSKLGITTDSSLYGCDKLAEILAIASKSPMIPIEWVMNSDIDVLIDKAEQYKELSDKIIRTTDDLKEKYGDALVRIDAPKYRSELLSLMGHLKKHLTNDIERSIAQDASETYRNLINCETTLSALFESAKLVSDKLGISAPVSISQLIMFARSMQALVDVQDVRPTLKWFDANEHAVIQTTLDTRISLHNSTFEAKRKIQSKFDNQIFDLDFYPILQRFRGEYNSFLRVIKSGYYADVKLISSYLSQGGKLAYREVLDVLNTLKIIYDNQAEINANVATYKEDYGVYYAGLETQWGDISANLDLFKTILGKVHTLTAQLKSLIINGELPINDIVQFNSLYESCDVDNVFEFIKSTIRCDFNKTSEWSNVKVHTNKSSSILNEFSLKYQELMGMRTNVCDYDSLIADLDSIIALNNYSDELIKQKSVIYNLYKDYYNGIETDWNKLADALRYASELRALISEHSLPSSFVKAVCDDNEYVSYCNDASLSLTQNKHSIQDGVMWFASLFKEGETFYHCNILDLIERMEACMNNKHLLEEWVDYCSTRDKCIKMGMQEYIQNVDDLGVDSNFIVDAYLKRFYRLWLDVMLPHFPAVQNFRSRIHSQTIKEFCELDKGQLKIAQARVRERALSRIPDFNSINGARDEIAILKRELNKQRRLMPLRKLFMAIPNLITSLRPCFMMSPLSVSVFLEAQSYEFDIVIFDEASQVHTEDAIGAIMRGKQVIIVGDTQQLPPTSFFSTSLNDDDYDVDSDETNDDKDAGAHDSILEESIAVLPERSLRWHYRSRHEHLIAFSNVKIYNSQLITFPSSMENAPDCGVEYIYVKDGIYDRGSKKNNVVEAKKVADLVFEHFRKYPNRSLGVVTFSEAQQNAVDAAIRQRRLQNPKFDKFFIEDNDEPFFIKNLENVQGDERDTIIFSIGYAKDSKGLMYMNFGPLSREGGYRRLNVAITRAKHNVKLVGSILPSDIDLERTTSNGVKMLRSYIEFAQQGIVALEKELTYKTDLEFDSPFEESVYDLLQSLGYDVVTQVGCSGFRIDMAVKHPTITGKFAIGIECDGATYHSSRTARERDRLRQSVLEDMGWVIYRIWSTDWIKDQNTEAEKLINAIDRALGRAATENEDNTFYHNDNAVSDTIIPIIAVEEKIEPSEVVSTGYGFDVYERYQLNLADVRQKHREETDVIYDAIIKEQPIHFEELCRRIAPLYDRQKVTSVVRDEVNYIFRYKLKGRIEKDKNDFVKVKGFTDIKVRTNNPEDDYLRPITYICDEELAIAMKTIVLHSFGITPEDLFIVAAREFGFKRTGENIITSLRKAYNQMLKNGIVIEIDGKVSIK